MLAGLLTLRPYFFLPTSHYCTIMPNVHLLSYFTGFTSFYGTNGINSIPDDIQILYIANFEFVQNVFNSYIMENGKSVQNKEKKGQKVGKMHYCVLKWCEGKITGYILGQ